ncbi:MAG: hypothetical protein Harvfovirus38_8 [Harvfovirus sp.]|uniref:Uncharacterized protein n=1 Tax=Harvfovirus sp. TaxID=2487768 RepID=A0A3G5A4U6_9VIRU|nr:MAG: hypothetical protein Harvfovirus38_8 [Harvfovirus sp.]
MSGKKGAVSFELSAEEKKVAMAFLLRKKPVVESKGIYRIRTNSVGVSTLGNTYVGQRFETLGKTREWINKSEPHGQSFVIMKGSEHVEQWIYMDGWRAVQ